MEACGSGHGKKDIRAELFFLQQSGNRLYFMVLRFESKIGV